MLAVNGPAHIAAALLAGSGAAYAGGYSVIELGAVCAGALAAATLPDLDRTWDKSPNHRSITHSLIVAGLPMLGLLIHQSGSLLSPGALTGDRPEALGSLALIGFALGYLSHLLLDAMTPAGLPVLGKSGPYLRLFGSRGVGSGSLVELLFFFFCIVGAGWMFYQVAGLEAAVSWVSSLLSGLGEPAGVLLGILGDLISALTQTIREVLG